MIVLPHAHAQLRENKGDREMVLQKILIYEKDMRERDVYDFAEKKKKHTLPDWQKKRAGRRIITSNRTLRLEF